MTSKLSAFLRESYGTATCISYAIKRILWACRRISRSIFSLFPHHHCTVTDSLDFWVNIYVIKNTCSHHNDTSTGHRWIKEHLLPVFRKFSISHISISSSDRGVQQPQEFPALCSCCCTDLRVQVDICNAVEGKLVAIGAILVDVSHCQARQLPHRFVVTGHGSKFNRSQRKLLAVHAHTVTGQHEQRQQERATSVHGGRAFSEWRVKFVLLCLCSVSAVTFGIKTNVDKMTGTKFAWRQRGWCSICEWTFSWLALLVNS